MTQHISWYKKKNLPESVGQHPTLNLRDLKDTHYKRVKPEGKLVIKSSSQNTLTTTREQFKTNTQIVITVLHLPSSGAASTMNGLTLRFEKTVPHCSQRSCWPVLLTTRKIFGVKSWKFMMHTNHKSFDSHQAIVKWLGFNWTEVVSIGEEKVYSFGNLLYATSIHLYRTNFGQTYFLMGFFEM